MICVDERHFSNGIKMLLSRFRSACNSIPRRVRVAPASVGSRSINTDSEKTHFGFKTVDANEKAALVGEVFKNVAQR